MVIVGIDIEGTGRATGQTLMDIDTSSDFSWKGYRVEIGAQSKGFRIYIASSSEKLEKSIMTTFFDSFKMLNCAPSKDVDKGLKLSCDFETDLCGWTNVKNDKSTTPVEPWIKLSTPFREPGNDHTSLIRPKPAQSGTWVGIQSENHVIGYLKSKIPLKENTEYCFSFWYYLMSYNSHYRISLYAMDAQARLPVVVDEAPINRIVQLVNVNQRNWLQTWVHLEPSAKQRYLLFYTEVTKDAFVGLDDFLLSGGNCSEFSLGGTCNFEDGQCAWKTPDGGWKIDSKNGKSHTTDDSRGHYMRQDADVEKEAVMSLALDDAPEIASLQGKKSMCINIYYKIKTEQFMTAEYETYVGIRALDQYQTVVRSVNISATQVAMEDHESVWSMMALNFEGNPKTTLEIFGQRQKKDSVLLVDDVSIHDRPCEVNGNCDFESDMCGWTNDFSRKSAIFVRFQPLTEYKNKKFLRFDHTTKKDTGHYLIYTTFNGDTDTQKLLSPMIRSPSSTICLSFWYFAQAENYQTLAIKLVFKSLTFQNGRTIEIYMNSTKFEWTEWKQTLKGVPRFFSLYFQFIPNVHFESDVGFDDILIDIGACDNEPTPTEIAPESERQLDCDMETGNACKWKFTSGWKVGSFADRKLSFFILN